MFSFNFFQGSVCNWVLPACCTGPPPVDDESCDDKPPRSSKDLKQSDNIRQITSKYNITILPIPMKQNHEVNLYPDTNMVETWNIFVVGSDKTYILANVNDPFTPVPNKEEMLNHKADNIIPPEMLEFFDAVWDQTLDNNKLQFYIAWNERLFRVNTYPLVNELNIVVGATMFMRAFKHSNYDAGDVALKKMLSASSNRQHHKNLMKT